MAQEDQIKEEETAKDPEALEAVKKGLAKSSLPQEIIEILQHEDSRIDVNVLLVSIVEKSSPNKFVGEAKEFLALTKDFEAARLENFKARADAVIDVKSRDPDDIEKRANNRTRRTLKYFIAGTGAVCIVGAVASVMKQSGIVVTGMLVSLAALCVAMLAPLAAGESVSSNDVARIMKAVSGMLPRTGSKKSRRSNTKEDKR